MIITQLILNVSTVHEDFTDEEAEIIIEASRSVDWGELAKSAIVGILKSKEDLWLGKRLIQFEVDEAPESL